MCERIIYNLNANGYLDANLEDVLGADATPEDLGAGQTGVGSGAEARPAALRGAIFASACSCS